MTQPPSAEPTLWELHRALQQLREDQSDGIKQLRDDLRGDLAAMSTRFEQMVTKDVYQADQRLVKSRSAGCTGCGLRGRIQHRCTADDPDRARESIRAPHAQPWKWAPCPHSC